MGQPPDLPLAERPYFNLDGFVPSVGCVILLTHSLRLEDAFLAAGRRIPRVDRLRLFACVALQQGD